MFDQEAINARAEREARTFTGMKAHGVSRCILRRPPNMLEFEPNTIAMLTASLAQCCKKLKNDTPKREYLSRTNIRECAPRGRVSLAALKCWRNGCREAQCD